MPPRPPWSATLAALTLLAALPALAAAGQAHEPIPNDEPASRYAIEDAQDVSLEFSGWDGPASLDPDGSSLAVEIANERPAAIHNVTVILTGTPAGVEVTVSEAHASAPTPERAVLIPHVETGGSSGFGLGLNASAADPGGADLEALVIFEDADGTRHAARDQLSLTIESSMALPGPSAALGAFVLVASALAVRGTRDRAG